MGRAQRPSPSPLAKRLTILVNHHGPFGKQGVCRSVDRSDRPKSCASVCRLDGLAQRQYALRTWRARRSLDTVAHG